MEYTIQIVNPMSDTEWDAYIGRNNQSLVFHSSLWAEVLSETYKQLTPYYLLARNTQGVAEAALPLFLVKSPFTGKRFVSLPFTLYSGVLADNPSAKTAVLSGAKELLSDHGAGFLEIRNVTDSVDFPEGIPVCSYVNHILELCANRDDVWRKFSRTNIRQHIRKASVDDFKVRKCENIGDLDIFYKLFVSTRKKFGMPPQPLEFFKNVWNKMVEKGKAVFYITTYQGKPVMSVMVLLSKTRYHLEYAGLDYDYYSLNPSVVTYWKIIQDALETGACFVEFGGSALSNRSLRRFKGHWGAEEESIVHCFYPENRGLSANWERKAGTEILLRICRHMPDALFVRMGRAAYRHLGG